MNNSANAFTYISQLPSEVKVPVVKTPAIYRTKLRGRHNLQWSVLEFSRFSTPVGFNL